MSYISPGRAKLSDEDVKWIRKWYADGIFEKDELALIYDVNVLTINGIVVRRKIWKEARK